MLVTWLIKGDITISWVDCEEGHDGDYNPNDPNDESFLRFDVDYKGETIQSFCTLMLVNTPEEILQKGLDKILSEVEHKLLNDEGIKSICADLSWMHSLDFTIIPEPMEYRCGG